MKKDILKIIICPHCRSHLLDLNVLAENKVEVSAGEIICQSCHHKYVIQKGIIQLIDHVSDSGAKEVEEINQRIVKDKLGELMSREWLLKFPDNKILGHNCYRNDVLRKSAENAILFLSQHRLPSTAMILEVGAGNCWLTARLAENYNIVALDVLLTCPLGLETADVFIENRGVFFERVLSDMSFLPFQSGAFDVVIFNSALHHTPDLIKTLNEVNRVLKPGGMLVLLGEPATGLISGPKRRWVRLLKEIGINENEISIRQWIQSFRKSAFDSFQVFLPSNIEKVLKGRNLFFRFFGSIILNRHLKFLFKRFTIFILFLFDGFFNAILYKK